MEAATAERPAAPEDEQHLAGEHPDEQAPPPESPMPGARGAGARQMALDVRVPVKPTRSTVKFTGEGEFEVDGVYDVGDKIVTIREATVEFGGIQGHRDRAADELTSSTRKQTAHVDRTLYIRPDQWERIQAILEDED